MEVFKGGRYSMVGAIQYFMDMSNLRTPALSKLCQKELDVNLGGKTCVVAGANGGIGKATAKALAERHGEVHMLCRSRERGEAAKMDIVSATGNKSVELHIVDLAECESIHKFCEDFNGKGKEVDILVNNVAILPDALNATSTNLEAGFATNLVGWYQLTKSLKYTKTARIVNLVSAGMYASKLNVPVIAQGMDARDINAKTYDGLMLYSQHHRGRVLLTERLAAEFEGIPFNCVHPGWVDTPGLASSKPMATFYKKFKDRLRSLEEGADTVVWLAVAESEAATRETGKYWFDRKVRSTHKVLAGTRSSQADVDRLVDLVQRGWKRGMKEG